MSKWTSISVSPETKEKLKALAENMDDTYDDIIRRLLKREKEAPQK